MRAVLFKNGVEIDRGDAGDLMRVFADPGSEAYMYDAGMTEFNFNGEFEFVVNNDVFLLKNEEVI